MKCPLSSVHPVPSLLQSVKSQACFSCSIMWRFSSSIPVFILFLTANPSLKVPLHTTRDVVLHDYRLSQCTSTPKSTLLSHYTLQCCSCPKLSNGVAGLDELTRRAEQWKAQSTEINTNVTDKKIKCWHDSLFVFY